MDYEKQKNPTIGGTFILTLNFKAMKFSTDTIYGCYNLDFTGLCKTGVNGNFLC